MNSLHTNYRLMTGLLLLSFVVLGTLGYRSFERWQTSETFAARARSIDSNVSQQLALAGEERVNERVLDQWQRNGVLIAHDLEGLAVFGREAEIIDARRQLDWSNEIFALLRQAASPPAAAMFRASLGTVMQNLDGWSTGIYQDAVEQRREAMNQAFVLLALSAAIIALLLIVTGMYLRRHVLRPLRAMVAHIEAYGSGQRTERVPKLGVVELDALATTFNRTADQLDASMVSRDDLEQEVVERVRAEEETRLANQELKRSQAQVIQMEKLSALGTLVGGVAHEVNNPLMGIHGYLAYAIGALEPGRPREMLERAVGEVERVARIVKNMLVYARMQPAAADQHCDPARVIADTLALIEGEMRQADVVFDVRLPPLAPRLRCTADALQQVLLNLLLNACHACKESPAPHRVTVTLVELPERSRAVLSIADNGPGVPDAIKARIFDPFFTTRSTGSGTGLGLAVSRQLIDNAGGQLTQADALGGGAVFLIELGVFLVEG